MGRRRFSKWMSISLAFLLVCLFGCSSSGGRTQYVADEEITLKFIWWGNDQRKEKTQQVIDLYMKEHPGVKIETEVYSNTTEVATQLAMETADQNTADIIQGDYNFIFKYIDRDLIEPLGSYIDNNILNLTNISSEYLTSGMKNDELYAVTIGINSDAFVYDPDFFAKVGVSVPDEDYTIDELYNTLVQLKQAVNDPEFYPLGNLFSVNYFLRTKGVSLFNADGTGLGYDDDQDIADYLALYKKWTDEGLLGAFDGVKNDENHPIITGRIALFSVSSNASTTLSSKAGRTIKLLPYPKIGEHEGRFIKPSMFLAVSSYSKYPEEAVKFVDFFINNEEANDILNGERGVPVSTAIASRLSAKLDEAGKQQYELLDYVKGHSSPIDPPNPNGSTIINKAFEIVKSRVLDGSLTPEQGAKQFREDAESILRGTGEVE